METTIRSLWTLYREVFPASFFKKVARQSGQRRHRGIYSLAVLVWLMMTQRLLPNPTLAAAVEQLLPGLPPAWRRRCKRASEQRISANTAGYCQARQRLPKMVVEAVYQRTLEHYAEQLQQGWPDLGFPVYVIDGSTLQLEHEEELVGAYPPARNQHGVSHWPVLQILVLHDTYSGLALEPVWGPMYGPEAVSEQAQARQAMLRLPAAAVLIGDGNFGIFVVCYAADQQRRRVVMRLTASRARKLCAGPLQPGSDQAVVWRPSRWDRRQHPELPPTAAVAGRLLVYSLPGARESQLYLFTTLELPGSEVLHIYGLRWNIETDLRSLKQTVQLERLTAKSKDMVEKELLLGFAAYNLVRAVMALAARKAGCAPRDLSFSRVLGLVRAFLPALADGRPRRQQDREFDRLLHYAATCKLPKRASRRSYPRLVWGQGYRFLTRRPAPLPEKT